MEITISGPGEVVIRYIDRNGRTLLQEKLVVSGSETVQAKRNIALHADTTSGRVLLSPVLVRQSNPHQRVTFDNENPSRFTSKRCDDIGCPSAAANDAERGCAPAVVEAESAMVMSDDQAIAKVIEAAARNEK